MIKVVAHSKKKSCIPNIQYNFLPLVGIIQRITIFYMYYTQDHITD